MHDNIYAHTWVIEVPFSSSVCSVTTYWTANKVTAFLERGHGGLVSRFELLLRWKQKKESMIAFCFLSRDRVSQGEKHVLKAQNQAVMLSSFFWGTFPPKANCQTGRHISQSCGWTMRGHTWDYHGGFNRFRLAAVIGGEYQMHRINEKGEFLFNCFGGMTTSGHDTLYWAIKQLALCMSRRSISCGVAKAF